MSDLINELAERAFTSGATDLFLYEDQPPRMRVDGEVRSTNDPTVDFAALHAFWKRCGVDPEVELERDVSYLIPSGQRLRANLYKSLGQLAVVLRPIKSKIPTFAELGLPGDLLTNWLERRSGLILVTGATGSGKSTSLACGLQWINEHHKRHIVTIEDPVEYLFSNTQSFFSQREINSDTESFAKALRSSLRQSPDVILLGEIRDEETAVTALQAAETGHLVLTTLHSTGVADSIERLTNIFSADNRTRSLKLLSNHLIGVLSQQLLPRKEGGLLAALEHLENAAATRKWIRESKYTEISDFMNRGDNPANCSFLRYLVAATEQGFLDPEVARSSCATPQNFDRALKGIG